MDENESLLSPEREICSPSPQAELNEPSPQSELPSLPRQAEEYFVERRESAEDGGEKKTGTARRLIRYVAAAAAAVGLLAEAAAPASEPTPKIEYVGMQGPLVIECAAVLPDEPEVLRFSDYIIGPSDFYIGFDDVDYRYYLVDPDGTETELSRYDIRADAEHMRYCFALDDDSGNPKSNPTYVLLPDGEEAYAYLDDPNWRSYGNVGFHMSCLPIDGFREGMSVKIVMTYLRDGVYYRDSAVREIALLSFEPEISVSLETEPLGDGMSQARFRAVLHPREDDDHVYLFGSFRQLYEEHPEAFRAQQTDDGALRVEGRNSIDSFCVRWYDADRQFLHEGWMYVVPTSAGLRSPTVSHEGRDFIITYDGPVQSSSPNEDAAFYSLELNLVDVSTGWHYLIETEQVPITD